MSSEGRLATAKRVVLDYYEALDQASAAEVKPVLRKHTTDDYLWRGVHPFHEQHGADAVADVFWQPVKRAFSSIQRRPDVFLAGANVADKKPAQTGESALGAEVRAEPRGEESSRVQANAARAELAESGETVGATEERAERRDGATRDDTAGSGERRPRAELAEPGVWVCQMGHLLGLFDAEWLDIPPTRKMCFLRYAEFHRVEGDLIAETAIFTDVISVMRQAGHYPLPPATGASHIYPGPRSHDGLLLDEQQPDEGKTTMALVHEMIDDLTRANEVANETGENRVPRSVMAKTWHEDMIWSGPEGIGATFTIDRYQEQHQYPFRFNLANKHFKGHVARFGEGSYACFFGWANLTNTAAGGFLGMTANNTPAEMRVVDVYRRDGDKLAENWVFIDLLHWLDIQGLDVLARMRQLLGKEQL